MENRDSFRSVRMQEENKKWLAATARLHVLYNRNRDIRTDFARDYTRIIHSNAYRRLKGKTQVFFATKNDHVCTRIEHVNHVSSISYSVAKYLGLNSELTMAIAVGHDLGHPPFGHAGEKELALIAQKELGASFWHEQNSLRFVDLLERLPDHEGIDKPINLTYAVRDGIISHCGEVDENGLIPRKENVDLMKITRPGEYQPYTWEGCVVKITDKIAYLGRDIEDAEKIGILSDKKMKLLIDILRKYKLDKKDVTNSFLIYSFIRDLCSSSHPEKGICFSLKYNEMMCEIKEFNYEHIYYHKRIENYKKYIHLLINALYETLMEFYPVILDKGAFFKKFSRYYPRLTRHFWEWIEKYGKESKVGSIKPVYDLEQEDAFKQAVIDFISGMTDHFAIKMFDELTSF